MGDTVYYEMTVKNTGNTQLSSVNFSDPRCDNNTQTGPGASDTGSDGKLDPGETWTYHCSHQITAGDPLDANDNFKNSASASAQDSIGGANGSVSDSADAFVTVEQPAIQVTKQ